jgi:SAM-dependent methyltransferase
MGVLPGSQISVDSDLATLVAATGFIFALLKDGHFFWLVGTAVALSLSSFVWGYSTRALNYVQWPSLAHLHRERYAEVWDALAATSELAKAAARGHGDEAAVRRSAETPLKNLIELAGVRPEDDILEFGCGVAGLGLELASRCRSWTGADLSANMLTTAAQRLRGVGQCPPSQTAADWTGSIGDQFLRSGLFDQHAGPPGSDGSLALRERVFPRPSSRRTSVHRQC